MDKQAKRSELEGGVGIGSPTWVNEEVEIML